MKKSILLTFDYEPYLGARSGTTEKCLIQPTIALINVLNKYSAKAIFFIDTLYILNLKRNPRSEEDYNRAINQIRELYIKGHYIFPHIHPHWLDAKYLPDIKQYDLSNLEKYSLASVNNGQVEDLFQQSFSLFSDLGIYYNAWGYRAGGWCIQPFSRYVEIFRKYHIRYDFSVLPYYKNKKQEQYFDFSQNKEKEPYPFQNDVNVVDSKGDFTEFPISSIEIDDKARLLSRIVNKYLWTIKHKGFGDGTGAQTAALQSTQPAAEMISIDIFNIAKLNSYKKFLEEHNYMHWISHPKMLTKHGLQTFDKFLQYAYSKFKIEHDFT